VTLVAWHITDTYAEILTDTLAYSVGEAEFTQVSKVDLFPHIDLAIAGKGPHELGALWRCEVALQAVAAAGGIDQLRDLAELALPAMWQGLEQTDGTRDTGWVWHVGWSRAQQRLVGHEFEIDSEQGLRCTERSGFSSSPALAEPHDPPRSDAEWIAFAEAVYAEHSVAFTVGGKTMIGGDLILTRLEHGRVSQRRIHTLPNDDWRFRRMVIGTVHRYGQLGPCVCGSAQPYILCCLTSAFSAEWLCPCDTGVRFQDCEHRVDPMDPEAMQHWIDQRQDFYDTQDELRARWLKAFPDDPRPVPVALIIPPRPAPVEPEVKQERNAPCACGSGRKTKKCCSDPRRTS
jgi:uncharacterized protein YchJ